MMGAEMLAGGETIALIPGSPFKLVFGLRGATGSVMRIGVG